MSKLNLPRLGSPLIKKDLRKEVRQSLSSLSQDDINQQSRDARAALMQMKEYQECRSISIFMSMPTGEIPTQTIVQHALDSGKKVFIPYIYKTATKTNDENTSIMDMLQLKDKKDYESLKPDKWGIPSIDAQDAAGRLNCFGSVGLTHGQEVWDRDAGLDIILMPAVAFDEEMNRLGHGKGYYDKFLARYHKSFSIHEPSKRRPYLVGLALQEQILPSGYRLPIEPWDHPVDVLVLGGRVVSSDPSTGAI